MAELRALPNNGHAPDNEAIAKHMRELADWVQAGDMGELRNVFTVFETMDGQIFRRSCGHPCDRARMVVILTMAATGSTVGDGQ
jgi:hypothetical protein